MLIIRLTRTGKKNSPSFRIVVIEKTAPPKSGKFLEILGNYNPRLLAKVSQKRPASSAGGSASGGKEINLKKERIDYWLSQGAQTSAAVHNLLINQGIIKGAKIKKKIRDKKKKEKPAKGEKEEKEIKKEKEETPAKEDSLPKADVSLEQTSDKKEDVSKEIKKEKKPAKDESLPKNEDIILGEKGKKNSPNLDKSEEKSKIEKE